LCECDFVVGMLEAIPTEDEVAQALGITDELVDQAMKCYPDGSISCETNVPKTNIIHSR